MRAVATEAQILFNAWERGIALYLVCKTGLAGAHYLYPLASESAIVGQERIPRRSHVLAGRGGCNKLHWFYWGKSINYY